MMFADRQDAGRSLAARLRSKHYPRPVVLALPRGGVPVGYEIAAALAAPLDVVLVRKIGAPMQEELAIGAIADGEHPDLVTDPNLIAYLGVPDTYIEQTKTAALQEIERRRQVYLRGRAPVDVAGRTAILVDDGLATGATMRAALRATRRRRPARLVLAVPVAPADALDRMRGEADETICLHPAELFDGVGAFYRDFRQLRDEDVTSLLDRARDLTSSVPPPA
ncbi:MAG TPA: phosphoribosyltransferase family protein [Acetobacteraceae bacterium]|nr:phosphoribosyltransferase family protein [Acetobacteraceae bacterium]